MALILVESANAGFFMRDGRKVVPTVSGHSDRPHLRRVHLRPSHSKVMCSQSSPNRVPWIPTLIPLKDTEGHRELRTGDTEEPLMSGCWRKVCGTILTTFLEFPLLWALFGVCVLEAKLCLIQTHISWHSLPISRSVSLRFGVLFKMFPKSCTLNFSSFVSSSASV